MINLWHRLQRTRAFTKQLHFGQRFNFRAILRFVRGRITISNHSCQIGPMSDGKEPGKLAKAAANLKRSSRILGMRPQSVRVCRIESVSVGELQLRGSTATDRKCPLWRPIFNETSLNATYTTCSTINTLTALPLTSKWGFSWVMGENCCTQYNHVATPNRTSCAGTGFPGTMTNMAMQVTPSSDHNGGVHALTGDGAVVLPDGVLSRMQLSPYRVQLAGIQTTELKQQAIDALGECLAIPDSAVIDNGTTQMVYVESMPGMFDGVAVKLGERTGDQWPVREGLKAGQRVATSGSFLIDAEPRLNPSLAAAYFGASGRGASESSTSTTPHSHRKRSKKGASCLPKT